MSTQAKEFRVIVDDWHEAEQTVRVGAGERVRYLLPALRGIDAPRRRTVILEGEGAHAEIYGLFFGQGEGVLHLTLDTIHQAARTKSYTLFKGMLLGKSVMDVNGVIRIEKSGHGADALLEEHALLLSPDALATTIPSLEIEANDVKCKHAATAGPVDPELLFYLRSRGLTEQQAEALIVRGFLGAVIRHLDPATQRNVTATVEKLFASHV